MGGRIKLPNLLIVSIALSAGCTPVVPAMETATIPAAAADRTPTVTASPTATRSPSPTLSPTAALPEYPNIILPRTARLQEIFEAGQGRGSRRGAFSKVGDSITDNGLFLVPFGTGDYSLGQYGYLQEVIDFFSLEVAREGNSFVNDSLAARTSWRAEHVLSPAKAQAPCRTGEFPLVCEYRLVQPAVAVILLGTNDAAAPTGTFETSYRRIVSETLDRGILPILNTLPPLPGKDVEPFNAVIRRIAAEREVPWIDLYAALDPLPNHGLAPDGIHLSWIEPAVFEPRYLNQGMTLRNLLTLQALDAVWRSFPSP